MLVRARQYIKEGCFSAILVSRQCKGILLRHMLSKRNFCCVFLAQGQRVTAQMDLQRVTHGCRFLQGNLYAGSNPHIQQVPMQRTFAAYGIHNAPFSGLQIRHGCTVCLLLCLLHHASSFRRFALLL